MATVEGAAGLLSEVEHRRQLRRAVIASTIGTTIEWYDFFIYGTATGLVFAKLYFPSAEPLMGTLQAFAVYAVGFVARPVGAVIFGHFGDRVGRKAALIATLLLMGIATFLVAFVPGYARIGIWGAVILTILRTVQGIGVGGEWGGSVLMSMEWARTNAHRGFIAAWPQFGVPSGLFLANLAVLFFSWVSGPQFLVWGWRIPFLLSIVLVGIGLYIRLGILETPTFQRLVAEDRIERAPALEVIRRQPKEIILTALARMAEQAPFYIFTAFVFTYGTRVLHSSRDLLLAAVLVASVVSFFTIPIAGHLSDRIGRKRMYLIGAVTVGVFGFIYFALLDTMVPGWIFLAIVLSLIPHDLMYGPQAALIAECFTGRLRYSGASIGYQLASVFAGGPAPLIATALFAAYQTGWAI
ncbi:MAG TPA: MFS transporter, partial [Stellaceae bacterium]|nr:MFS transporter [Stellaceae bacterium]